MEQIRKFHKNQFFLQCPLTKTKVAKLGSGEFFHERPILSRGLVMAYIVHLQAYLAEEIINKII
jgi:hypothetical protein